MGLGPVDAVLVLDEDFEGGLLARHALSTALRFLLTVPRFPSVLGAWPLGKVITVLLGAGLELGARRRKGYRSGAIGDGGDHRGGVLVQRAGPDMGSLKVR